MSREDFRIRSTVGKATTHAQKSNPKNKMKPWNEITHYAGFDWAKDHHDIVIVDREGKIVADFRIEHSAAGWKQWQTRIEKYNGVAVCIETSQGAAIEKLLETGCAIYPINPKSSKRFRERKVSSGNKTDRLDAWSCADALRVDGHGWRALSPQDPLIQLVGGLMPK